MQKCLDLIVLGAVWYLDCTFHRHMKAIDFRRTKAQLSDKHRRMLRLCLVHET